MISEVSLWLGGCGASEQFTSMADRKNQEGTQEETRTRYIATKDISSVTYVI
jgi:hypothetical protein